MSLKEAFPSEIPPETAQVVEALLPVNSVYRVVVECVNDFLSNADFQVFLIDKWIMIE